MCRSPIHVSVWCVRAMGRVLPGGAQAQGMNAFDDILYTSTHILAGTRGVFF